MSGTERITKNERNVQAVELDDRELKAIAGGCCKYCGSTKQRETLIGGIPTRP